MALQPQSQYDFRYENVKLVKTEKLGFGSYGAVYKAMCDNLPCAAKILHSALFQFTTPATTSVARKFEQECCLLSAIKHPHIVQYLGTYYDPEEKLPVLLMELMDESLTQFLKRAQEPLPYHTEVNLCYDITLALSYLHSHGIVHRDLSSNNVLLLAGSRAKVTDFGMAKLYDVNHSKALVTPLTLCPGTVAYMSPEALAEPPVYTDKLDSFSLGVLAVQIMSLQFPNPGDRFWVMQNSDPRIPSNTVKVDIPEIERRQSHISLINPTHPLLPVARDCLKDNDRERPSCHEICGHISTLKASSMYTESVQQYEADYATCQQKIQQLRQQLQSTEQKTSELHHNLKEGEKRIEELQKKIQELQKKIQELQLQLLRKGEAASGGMELRWRDGGRAPNRIWGEAATVSGNVAYFRPGGIRQYTVLTYDSAKNNWSELPSCPNCNFSLAVVRNLLTAIGGETLCEEHSDSLFSFIDNKWKPEFPRMPTKRWLTAVVSSNGCLVVAGGKGKGYQDLRTVEVMNTITLQWSTACRLPHPLYQATATLCGDRIYMLGGRDQNGKWSKSVFTCSVADLIQSSQSKSGSMEMQVRSSSLSSKPKVWQRLTDTPLAYSTCASLDGRLLAVGGMDSDNKLSTALHVHNATSNSWEIISHMATPRFRCLVAVLPQNELMVVGSYTPGETDSVEIATIV